MLVEPLEKVTADIANALAGLNERRATTTAAKGRESGLGAAKDQRCFNSIDGSIKPFEIVLGWIFKGGRGGASHYWK